MHGWLFHPAASVITTAVRLWWTPPAFALHHSTMGRRKKRSARAAPPEPDGPPSGTSSQPASPPRKPRPAGDTRTALAELAIFVAVVVLAVYLVVMICWVRGDGERCGHYMVCVVDISGVVRAIVEVRLGMGI